MLSIPALRIPDNSREQLQERELQERELQERELQGRELQGRELRERELRERELRERSLPDEYRCLCPLFPLPLRLDAMILMSAGCKSTLDIHTQHLLLTTGCDALGDSRSTVVPPCERNLTGAFGSYWDTAVDCEGQQQMQHASVPGSRSTVVPPCEHNLTGAFGSYWDTAVAENGGLEATVKKILRQTKCSADS